MNAINSFRNNSIVHCTHPQERTREGINQWNRKIKCRVALPRLLQKRQQVRSRLEAKRLRRGRVRPVRRIRAARKTRALPVLKAQESLRSKIREWLARNRIKPHNSANRIRAHSKIRTTTVRICCNKPNKQPVRL